MTDQRVFVDPATGRRYAVDPTGRSFWPDGSPRPAASRSGRGRSVLWAIGLFFVPYVMIFLPVTWRKLRAWPGRIALMVWAAILAIGSLTNSPPPPPAESALPVQSAPPVAPAVGSAEVSSPSPTQPSIVQGRRGQAIRYGNLQVTVTGTATRKTIVEVPEPANRGIARIHIPHVHCRGRCNVPNLPDLPGSDSSSSASETASGSFLLVYVTIQNNGTDSSIDELSDIKLVDTNGQVHSDDSWAAYLLKQEGHRLEIPAGGLGKGVEVFDMPTGLGPRRLEMRTLWPANAGVTVLWP